MIGLGEGLEPAGQGEDLAGQGGGFDPFHLGVHGGLRPFADVVGGDRALVDVAPEAVPAAEAAIRSAVVAHAADELERVTSGAELGPGDRAVLREMAEHAIREV